MVLYFSSGEERIQRHFARTLVYKCMKIPIYFNKSCLDSFFFLRTFGIIVSFINYFRFWSVCVHSVLCLEFSGSNARSRSNFIEFVSAIKHSFSTFTWKKKKRKRKLHIFTLSKNALVRYQQNEHRLIRGWCYTR